MEDDMSNARPNAPLGHKYVSVLLDQGLDKALDYLCSKPISVGMRVLVPVQNSLRKGTIIALKKKASVRNLKEVHTLLTEKSLISKELFKLATWISEYYCTPFRKVLHLILPPPVRKEVKMKKQLFVKRAFGKEATAKECRSLREKHPSQAKILETLLTNPKGLFLTDLLEKSRCSKSPVETLEKRGYLSVNPVQVDHHLVEEFEFFQTKPKRLNSEQKIALKPIISHIGTRTFQTHLIHGITGSGKTEVYLQAIEKARAKKRGVIFLVPEIALTSQTIEKLRSRFTERLGILHHRLSDGERSEIWHAILKGEISIVVGARSAIFCPVKELGLIIVDEEHEISYKQMEEQPCYHTRDVAIMRGKVEQAPVILGSATPSFETYKNSKSGKYQLSTLTKRATRAPLPKLSLIDMKREYSHSKGFTLFSQPLLDALKERIKRGEQSLLFLNRRGYHTFQLCINCDQTLSCPHCAISLTFHKKENLLACHLCSFKITPPPVQCPYCKKEATLRYKGVGTERIEKALSALFPEARTLRMDADTTRHKGSQELLLKSFRSGKADILIGTQMIAKGLHFPAVTLVGVLNLDGSLNLPDFRASEWVFQLLTQVAGRAGRESLEGEVMIQTCLKENPVLSLATQKDYATFFEKEMKSREILTYPPFIRLAKITFSGASEQRVLDFANHFRSEIILQLPASYSIFPVIPSGYAKIKGLFRFKLLLKGAKSQVLSRIIRKTLMTHEPGRAIRVLVDIDPLSTFS